VVDLVLHASLGIGRSLAFIDACLMGVGVTPDVIAIRDGSPSGALAPPTTIEGLGVGPLMRGGPAARREALARILERSGPGAMGDALAAREARSF